MIFLNNGLVPLNKALISVYDHGFLYGDGIYETLRSYNGTVFMIDEHIMRLFRSASLIEMNIRKTSEEIKHCIHKTIKANRLKDAVIRITVSRGYGPTGLDPDLCKEPTFVVMAHDFKEYPRKYYREGIRISVVSTRRNYRGALNPQIKSLNFLNNVIAKIEAKKSGAFEAIMLNHRGYVAEGTVSNIFFVKDGMLCTPGINVGILDGITRKIIIHSARELGIIVEEGYYKKDDLCNADEVFISNTTMEIMPVLNMDDVVFSSKMKTTKSLHREYRKKVNDYMKSDL